MPTSKSPFGLVLPVIRALACKAAEDEIGLKKLQSTHSRFTRGRLHKNDINV